MKRTNVWMLAVLLSPLAAFVGCPQAKTEKPSDDQPQAQADTNGTDRSSAENKNSSEGDGAQEKGANDAAQGSQSDVDEPLPEIFKGWPKPQVAIVISANQDGYIEPCGCIGLKNQKGGLSRRATFLKELRDKGWPLLLVDGGGLVRRYGPQAVLKYRTVIDMLGKLGYDAIAFGTADLRLPATELLVDVVEDKNKFVAANVAISGDFADKLTPDFREAKVAGVKFGITSILGKEYQEELGTAEIAFEDPAVALARVLPKMKAKCDKLILLSHATPEETRELAEKFTDFDVIVTAGGAVEPPTNPTQLEGKDQLIIDVGHKGSYLGVLGLFEDAKQPWRYERVPLDHRFKDSDQGRQMMREYQRQLKLTGLAGLGLKQMRHPTGHKFVGSEVCGDCHTTAYDIWKDTPHASAIDSIVKPPERYETARHFDPECISCHVVGWEPQKYFPFEDGYMDLNKSKHLHHVGCENCHGPGSAHVAAEEEADDEEVLKMLRAQMRISKETMKESFERGCVKCHDLDNDPNFEFDKYWKEVEHYGKD